MFEKAARMKLRFQYNGMLDVEDLWDLDVEQLDKIFKNLNSQLRQTKEESLLETKSQEDKVLDLKVQIVKHVVAVKLQEQKDNENRANRYAQKQKLLGVLEEKQDAELRDLSPEKLQEMIEAL